MQRSQVERELVMQVRRRSWLRAGSASEEIESSETMKIKPNRSYHLCIVLCSIVIGQNHVRDKHSMNI